MGILAQRYYDSSEVMQVLSGWVITENWICQILKSVLSVIMLIGPLNSLEIFGGHYFFVFCIFHLHLHPNNGLYILEEIFAQHQIWGSWEQKKLFVQFGNVKFLKHKINEINLDVCLRDGSHIDGNRSYMFGWDCLLLDLEYIKDLKLSEGKALEIGEGGTRR